MYNIILIVECILYFAFMYYDKKTMEYLFSKKKYIPRIYIYIRLDIYSFIFYK